jgi:hypothetical protein
VAEHSPSRCETLDSIPKHCKKTKQKSLFLRCMILIANVIVSLSFNLIPASHFDLR